MAQHETAQHETARHGNRQTEAGDVADGMTDEPAAEREEEGRYEAAGHRGGEASTAGTDGPAGRTTARSGGTGAGPGDGRAAGPGDGYGAADGYGAGDGYGVGHGGGHGGGNTDEGGDAGAQKGSWSRRGLIAASLSATVGGFGLLTACGASGEASDAKAGGTTAADRGGAGGHSRSPSPSPKPKPKPELPRGGRELFPKYRLFGYCGLPGGDALGKLGIGDVEDRAKEIEKKSHDYGGDREPLPVFELLATVVNGTAGDDGTYRTRTSPDTIGRFHDLARKHKAILLLNIQPGRAKVLDEVKALHKWLVHPDVGVALDPEWEMGPGEIPGQTFGHTSGKELSDVARYLSGVVEDNRLPEKPMIFHQVAPSVLHDEDQLKTSPGVAVIKSADGLGSPDLKRATWKQLVKKLPDGVHTGFKLFFEEDTRGGSQLMSPKDVLALKPKPEYVMYE